MAVTKRTRYEVLKRDNHTCRYCGIAVPEVVLTVDHVTPVALGGNDDPSNLVAACRDCNAGKSSTSPDAALVADVKADDLRWSQAIVRVAKARSRQRKKRMEYVEAFTDAWVRWTYGANSDMFPTPSNWQASIERFYDLGVSREDLHDCVRVACGNDRIAIDATFTYFAGCVWRVVDDMREAAKEIVNGP